MRNTDLAHFWTKSLSVPKVINLPHCICHSDLPASVQSEHLLPKAKINIFFPFHLASAPSFLHKPNLSTQRQLTGFYEQEPNRNERLPLRALRSVSRMLADMSLSHSRLLLLLKYTSQVDGNSVLCPRMAEHGDFHLGNRHSK